METTINHDLGGFEGFNFRDQCAIDRILTADEVLSWDHDAEGEAEFWPDGSNPFVSQMLDRSSFSVSELREVVRIFDELDGDEHDLVKACALVDRGSSLEEITRNAVDDSCLYVFGPCYFIDMEKEAAYELFEMFWPEAYKMWESNNVPGLSFDVDDFMRHFSTFEMKLPGGGGYLVVDTE
jgi:hypothetical protein